MQTPVEIDFQGMSGTPEVHASIEKHVAELEQRYGRVTACRVVLKGPGGHHRTGGLYEVNIRLALPNGREVNVGRTAQADERGMAPSTMRGAPFTSGAPPAPTAASRCNRPGSQLNVRVQADFRFVPIQLAEGRPLAEQLGNSVHVTVSTICRISFVCTQARIETE
jgi:hypothetical protein